MRIARGSGELPDGVGDAASGKSQLTAIAIASSLLFIPSRVPAAPAEDLRNAKLGVTESG